MSQLLDPIVFRNGARAPNRVALAAMTNMQSHDDGSLSDDELHWLAVRAEGGFGIVTSCASHVARDGQGWKGELGIYDDTLVPGWKRLAGALRDHGALSLAQIFHGGLRADPKLTGEQTWSADGASPASPERRAARSSKEGGLHKGDGASPEGPRAATEEDLGRVVGQFREAAVRAHTAGMDGVEIHGAHGYLLTQFLSRAENRRTDRWGGSLENRARLIREVTRAVRASVPSSFLVGVRISPEDFGNAKGLDLDESLEVARWLTADGIDFLHLSLWRASNNTQKRPEQHALTAFREVIPADVRLFVAGGIWTRADADRVLDLGADVVALARAAICNPDWPRRVADAAWEPKRPPLTAEELLARGLSPGFVGYMRGWKGFVA